jgi:tryptophanyl-tRNA synthetase
VLDSPDVIRKKIARAVTDSLGEVRFNPEQAGLFNLLSMIHLLSGDTPEAIEARHADGRYGPVKQELAELVIEALAPVRERYREYEAEPEIVDRTLLEGAERAAPMARSVVEAVESRLGLRRSARRTTPVAAL